ncbi:MAG: hypothetical protein E7185_04235 [Erysipelotrichaceae bacterium]|nr:hypothetical protein [Erysipelotrichaceae bacterium]
MDRKEEDKIIASRKRRYLFGVVAVFMTVYIFLYLVLTILNFVAEMHPYLKLFLMMAFLVISFYATKYAVTLKEFQNYVCRK